MARTSATNPGATSAAPSGAAGGDLSGTYPNPTVTQAAKLTTARTIDGQSFDGSGNITVIAPGTHAATGKTTPADADETVLVDSAASNVLKKLTWANLKATLKTYFDTLYPSGSGTSTGTNTGDSTSLAATAAAGGDLTGNYPNPTLATAGGGAAGPTGSTSVIPIVTVDAKGRVTALSSAAPTLNTIATANATAASVVMNSNKLTGLAAGTAAGDSARWEQTVGAGLPWVLTGDLKNVQIFTANGSWSKPGTGTLAVVWIKGAGGGGGGGGVGASTIKGGGGGGSGGSVFFGIPLSALGASATVTVGTGGPGGASNAGGTAGSATTQFDTVTGLCTTPASVTAGGGGAAGSAGTAGTAGTAAAPVYTGYTLSTTATNGGLGGAGAATTGGNGATGGGGAGGGLTGVPAAAAGGTGSLLNVTTTITGLGGVSGGANGGISVSPIYQPSGFGQGLGGGGGGSKLGGSGNNGGIGADGYGGGGGGGGGAAVTGGSGGAGGKGGDGVVVVFVF